MAAPAKDFIQIADADIDPSSPGTTGLFTKIRDALENLEEWLGKDFIAAINHDHDGINSKALILNLVFDQVTGASGSTSGAGGFGDIATITVASADLPINRNAQIIASGGYTGTGGPKSGDVRLLVDGVAKQTVPTRITAGGDEEQFALSEIVNLTSGADRIIKVQAQSDIGAPIHIYANVNLSSVLITGG